MKIDARKNLLSSVAKAERKKEMKWRIVRSEGLRGHVVITNDVDTYNCIHKDELYKYGLNCNCLKEVREMSQTEKSKLQEMQDILDKLKEMSAKQLVEHAKTKFNVDLNIGNGRPWLYKKIAYLEQERVMGTLTEMAAENAQDLDKPETIKEMKKEEERKEAAKMATKKDNKPAKARHEKLDRVEELLKEKKTKEEISKIMTKEFGEKTGNPKNVAVYIYRIKNA